MFQRRAATDASVFAAVDHEQTTRTKELYAERRGVQLQAAIKLKTVFCPRALRSTTKRTKFCRSLARTLAQATPVMVTWLRM